MKVTQNQARKALKVLSHEGDNQILWRDYGNVRTLINLLGERDEVLTDEEVLVVARGHRAGFEVL